MPHWRALSDPFPSRFLVKFQLVDELPPVLVVEDEMLVLLTIAEALEDGGYAVLQATDGASAIQMIDECESLRGLVTDIRLGAGPDGWEVAHHARLKFPCVAVAYATGDSAAEWPANGVPQSAILQKPFASAELVTALANLLIANPNIQPTDLTN